MVTSEGRAETEANNIRDSFNKLKIVTQGRGSKRKIVHSWTVRGKVQL